MTRRRDASPEPHWGCSMSTKMYGLIPRKQGMGRDEFHDYYRHPHGTMGRNMTTMRGYVQNHQIDTDRLGPGQARFDAVAEIWLDKEAEIGTATGRERVFQYV